jgi:hypothetical protein
MGENPGLKLAKIGHLKTLEMTHFPSEPYLTGFSPKWVSRRTHGGTSVTSL